MKKRILISTGGTGGHVIPATIFYHHLESSYEVFLCSDARGIKFLDLNKYNIKIIDVPKLSKNIIKIPINILIFISSIIKSMLFLKRKKIELLISTGGYMSLPLCLAAKCFFIKIILFEPNMVLGRSNKLFLRFSDKILCYSENLKNFPNKFKRKIKIIEPLVRKDFYKNPANKRNNKTFNLLILGGSQGASIFDKHIKDTIIEISKNYQLKIFQQTNFENLEELKNFYSNKNIPNHIFDYKKNLYDLIIDSDLCLTRAGASSLSELVFLKVPFIAIPLPSAKDNHQHENAIFYEKKGCCWVIDQKDFNKEKLSKILNDILDNKNEYLRKKNNMEKFNYQNSWNNINEKIIKIINEN